MDTREIEWQFEVVDVRPVERWLRARGEDGAIRLAADTAADQVDTYYDTEDWRLHRAGYSLRVRATGGQFEWTVKSLTPAVNSLRNRLELAEVLPDGDANAVKGARGAVGEYVRLLTGTHPVRAIFEVRTHRRAFPLQLGDIPVGEVLLDTTTIPVEDDDEPFRLHRVEVEVPASAQADVEPFVEELRVACDLQPAGTSKYEAGLLARGLTPPGRPELGSTVVHPSLSLGEVAFATMRKHFGGLLAHEPGTRLGVDPEELHDMRVATRRLRAAMSLFKEALPTRAPRLREELRWVASTLGEVRDLDVQLEQLHEWLAEAEPEDRPALESLTDVLRMRRAAARVRMLKVLDSSRYERLVANFTTMLRRGPLRTQPAARQSVLAAGPELIARRYRKLRKTGDRITAESPPEEYHALRIEGKRLRYALEFLSDVYGKPARELIAPLVAMQDILGKHQDSYVAISQLRELSAGGGRAMSSQTVFVMGGIAARYSRQAAELRGQFPKAYRALQGRPWKRLRNAMEALRPPMVEGQGEG